jgi:hypothetical protein
MLKAGLVDLIDRLSKLRLLRRLPLLPLLPWLACCSWYLKTWLESTKCFAYTNDWAPPPPPFSLLSVDI